MERAAGIYTCKSEQLPRQQPQQAMNILTDTIEHLLEISFGNFFKIVISGFRVWAMYH